MKTIPKKMTPDNRLSHSPVACKRCTGRGNAHYLTCPTLRLPAGYDFKLDDRPPYGW